MSKGKQKQRKIKWVGVEACAECGSVAEYLVKDTRRLVRYTRRIKYCRVCGYEVEERSHQHFN